MTGSSGAITLGAQTSAEDDRTMKHVIELRRLLSVRCQGPYSNDIAEFALILRIGGVRLSPWLRQTGSKIGRHHAGWRANSTW